MNKETHFQYNSIAAFGRYLKSLGDYRAPRADNASLTNPTGESNNYLSLDDSLTIACTGGAWMEGAKDLKAIEFSFDEQFEAQVRKFETSPVGFMPNMPSAIAGLPDSMIGATKALQKKPIIKIGIQNTFAHKVPQNYVFNRGRALLAVIERLELLGYRVEVWGISYTWKKLRKHIYYSRIDVCLKQTDEAANYAAMAFGLCCAAFLRRLLFRHMEGHIETQMLGRDNYGYTTNLRNSARKEFDVYVPCIDHTDYFWSDANQSRKVILNQFLNQLGAH